jgi:hypothetical protein
MRQAVLPVALSFALGLTGCSSKNLTRSKAKKIIQEALHFPQPFSAKQNLGILNSSQTTLEAFASDPVGKWYKTLNDRGLLTLEWKGTTRQNSVFGAQDVGIFSAHLTDKGRKYIVGQETGVDKPTGNYMAPENERTQLNADLKFCDKEFSEVTGIMMMDTPIGKGAKVDYTWKYGNPTPFETVAELVYGDKANCAAREPHAESAVLTLYDDGWRYQP